MSELGPLYSYAIVQMKNQSDDRKCNCASQICLSIGETEMQKTGVLENCSLELQLI